MPKADKITADQWKAQAMHVHHVREILVNNGLTEFKRLHVDPIQDQIDLGRKTGSLFAQMDQTLMAVKDKYPSLFFTAETLVNSEKIDETMKSGDEVKG